MLVQRRSREDRPADRVLLRTGPVDETLLEDPAAERP
jgi:hypothetical protein